MTDHKQLVERLRDRVENFQGVCFSAALLAEAADTIEHLRAEYEAEIERCEQAGEAEGIRADKAEAEVKELREAEAQILRQFEDAAEFCRPERAKTEITVAGDGRTSPERVAVPDLPMYPPADHPTCPSCGSRQPELHPAVQAGGEVQPCRDPWHRSTRAGMEAWERLPERLRQEAVKGEAFAEIDADKLEEARANPAIKALHAAADRHMATLEAEGRIVRADKAVELERWAEEFEVKHGPDDDGPVWRQAASRLRERADEIRRGDG